MPEREENYEFVIRIHAFGKREKIRPNLIRILCQGLYTMFGNRASLFGIDGEGGHREEYIFNAKDSEGGSITIRKVE